MTKSGLTCAPSIPEVRECNRVLSKMAGLPNGVTIDSETIVNLMQMFAAEKGIANMRNFAMYRREALPYMAAKLGLGVVVETSDKELANAINFATFSLPKGIVEDTPETRELVEAATDATGVPFSVLPLTKGKIMVLTPTVKETKSEKSQNVRTGVSKKATAEPPFIEELSNLPRVAVVNLEVFPHEAIKEADRKRKDVGITKQSKIYNRFVEFLDLHKFVDVLESSTELQEELINHTENGKDLLKEVNALAKKIKETNGIDGITQFHAKAGNEAKKLAKLFNEIQNEHFIILDKIAKEIWGVGLKPTYSKLSADEPTKYAPSSIKFIESRGDYSYRTKENADWSDVTIAFAVDFTTPGEKLTKRVAGNKYAPIKWYQGAPEDDGALIEDYEDIDALMAKLKKYHDSGKAIKLNIAGNGIYTFKSADQEKVNEAVQQVIELMLENGIHIAEIRSGGQTGVDEAGIVAAQRLGIPASVNAPKGWKFRDSSGKDISSEADFKARFESVNQEFERDQEDASEEIDPIEKTLDDYVEEANKMADFFSRNIIRGKGETAKEREADFEKNHTYYIKDENGKLKKVDRSVTQYNEELLKIPPYKGPNTPAARIGNTFDSFVRDYFDGGLRKVYDNLSKGQRALLRVQLDTFKRALDKKFGEGRYKVITKEFPIGGYIKSQTGKKLSIAGTMDMLVVTDTGDIYIYDMKTTSHDSINDKIPQYSGQLTLYKRLIEATFPELASRIKGIGLLVAKTNYAKDYGSYTYKGNEIYYDKSPIYEDENYSIELFHKSAKNLNGFIDPLNYNKAVEELEMSPLTEEEQEAIDDMPTGEDAEKIERRKDEKEIFNSQSKIGTVVETASDLCPVSSREVVFIGRSMIKMISWFCDRLSNGGFGHTADEWRVITGLDKYFKEGELEGVPADEILKKKDNASDDNFSIVWPTLRDFVRNFFFNDSNIEFDDPMYDKYNWVQEHFTDIINSAFSELVSIEGISVTGTTVESDDEVSQMYEIGAREEDGREAYAIDSRTKSYEASIPTKLKRKLAKIGDYQLDSEGNVEKDENGIPIFNADEFGYGIPVFLDKHTVINFLMHNLHYYKYASQMMDAMRRMAPDNPWLYQVIEMLEESPELLTMFKVAFRKNETYYNKLYASVEGWGRKAKKTLISTPLNEKSKILAILDNVNMKMVDPDGEALPDLFEHDEEDALGVVSTNEFYLENLKDDLAEIKKSRTRSDKVKILGRILEYLGIDNVDNLEILKSTLLAKQFSEIIKTINSIKRALEKDGEKKYNFSELLGSKYYALASALSVAMQNNVETSSHDGDKSYMTHTDPTFIETTIDELSGRVPDTTYVLDDPDSKYNKYRAFGRTEADGTRVYVNSMLTKLAEDPECREHFRHYVRTTSDEAPYIKQSDNQYWLSLIIDYFAPTTAVYYTSRKDLRIFRVPIMSDKPAGESFVFPVEATVDTEDIEGNYGLDEMKDAIAERAYEYFMYELLRMKSVLQQLRDGTKKSDVEDFHLNREKAKDLRAKLIKGQKLTEKDLLDENGKLLPIFRKSGMSFRYLPMFNQFKQKVKKKGEKETLELTPIAKEIIRYLNGEEIDFSNIMPMFIKDYRRGMEAEYFKFRIDLAASVTDEELDRDLPNVTSNEVREALLQEYFWNDSLRTMDIYNILDVDPAYYKDTVALQKRAAQWHSSTVKADVEATFKTKDGTRKRFSDGKHRTIIIEDVMDSSILKEETKRVFLQLAEEAEKQKHTKQAKEYRLLAETVPNFFEGFDATDGQAFGSPTGFWKKQGMLGELDPKFTAALDEIRKGNFNISNFRICIQPFKPFIFSHLHKDGNTAIGDELVPLQIKDSEAMILLAGAILQGSNSNSPMRALYDFMEETHYGANDEHNDDTYSQTGVDTIAFHSTVKGGAFNVLDINGLSYDEAMKVLRSSYLRDKKGRIIKDSKGNIKYDESIVKTIDFDDWGKQQNVPPHMQDHEQAMGSQPRVLFVTDIPDDITIDNNPIIVHGRKYGKQEFLDRYFNLIKQDFNSGIELVKRQLGLKGPKANKKLSDLLVNSIVKDDKYSYELQKIFRAIGTGEVPMSALGDPAIADKVYSTIFSLIKRNVNNEEMFGGPVVQVAPFGLSDNLHIWDGEGHRYGTKDFNANKGLIYDCYITAPSERIERLITYSRDNKRVMKLLSEGKLSREYEEGEILDINDIVDNGLLKQEELELIAYRIPTEDKYSIYRMRVAGFLPRAAGETIIMPKEIVPLSGTDFDIDKMYTMWRYNLHRDSKILKSAIEKVNDLKKKRHVNGDIWTDAFEQEVLDALTDKELAAYAKFRKNKIFDMQWGIGGHSSSVEKQLNPGNFEDLKTIVRVIHPNIDTDEDSLMYAHGQVRMHRKNSAGKDFVGIAALNNLSHGMATFGKLSFKPLSFKFIVNGVSSTEIVNSDGTVPVDEIFSRFTGERISRTLGKFVGAAADNAKEAVLGLLNITPTTANIAMFLMRFGLSSDTVALMMNHPLVLKASRAAENKGKDGRFEKELESIAADIIKEKKYSEKVIQGITESTDLTDEALLAAIRKSGNDPKKASEFDFALIQFLVNMIPYSRAISDLNGVLSLNSLQNAVGPDVYSTIKKEYQIKRFFDDVNSDDSKFSPSARELVEKIPFLKPLVGCYKELLPSICSSFSPLYQGSFRKILDAMDARGMAVGMMDEKTLKRLLNSYLLFRASQEGLIDTTPASRADLLYGVPVRFISDRFKYLKDNGLIQSISFKKEITKGVEIYSLYGNMLGLSREGADDLTASWDALLLNEKTAAVSDDLLKYMLCRFGFSWDPRSAVALASRASKIHMGNFDDIFIDSRDWSDDVIQQFVRQYARNNPKSSLWVSLSIPEEKLKVGRGGTIKLDKDDVTSDVDRAIGINVNGKLYEKIYSVDENTYKFKPVSKLGVQSKNKIPVFYEFDASTASIDMKTVVSASNIEKQKEVVKIANDSLLGRDLQDEDEDGDTGGENYTSGQPTKESSSKALEGIADEIYTDDSLLNILEEELPREGDESRDIVTELLSDKVETVKVILQDIHDTLSKNKKLKGEYKDLLSRIEKEIKKLC